MNTKAGRGILVVLACAAVIPLGGCVAVGLTALGVGMATGVSHTLGGIVYKTFSLPQAQVKKEASLPELGLKFKETIGVLPIQHIIIFERQKDENGEQPKPARE